MGKQRFRALAMTGAIVLGVLAAPAAHAADAGTVTDGVVKGYDGVNIYYSLFKPTGADADHQVPVIMHSHGWGGSRSKSVSSFNAWMASGFGVLSFDQRGHGQSTDFATVEDPDREGQDVRRLIDFIASLDWVQLDGPGDPVLGAIGGSYGGGYQTIGALTDLRDRGATRFNAIAPEITWYDLPESLGPQGVPRTLWTSLLYAAAPRHASYIDEAQAIGLATGDFPDGTVPIASTVPGANLKQIFASHSPRFFADRGMHLDIPVLFGQGITDNLFNLNQGLHNYFDVLTPAAQRKSIFVGYNSGHVLPEVVPLSSSPSGNNCIANWGDYERSFFHAVFDGQNPREAMGAASFNIATNDAKCIRTETVTNYKTFAVQPAGVVATPTMAGPPVSYQIASGPITVAGTPHLKGLLTTVGLDARAFFALSVGTSPADARVIQNNVMPIRSFLPVLNQAIDKELPAIGVEVPAGKNLYLTVSPISTQFAGAARTPGVVTISNAVVDVPIQ